MQNNTTLLNLNKSGNADLTSIIDGFKSLQDLNKDGVQVTIVDTDNRDIRLKLLVSTIEGVSRICSTFNHTIDGTFLKSVNTNVGMHRYADNFIGYRAIPTHNYRYDKKNDKLGDACNTRNYLADVMYINDEAVAKIENGITYRTIFDDDNRLLVCVPHTDNRFNYLDTGFFIKFYDDGTPDGRGWVVADELNFDTAAILYILNLNSKITKLFQNNTFISKKECKSILAKAEALVPKDSNFKYTRYKKTSSKERLVSLDERTWDRYIAGELKVYKKNGITFKEDSISCDGITISNIKDIIAYEKGVIYDTLGTAGCDIYEIANKIFKSVTLESQCHSRAMRSHIEKHGNDTIAPPLVHVLNVNGFEVKVSCSLAAYNIPTSRTINGARIRQDELLKVLNQALCFREGSEYQKFVNSVSRISLQRHKALSDGIYINLKPHDACKTLTKESNKYFPKLEFVLKNRKMHLCVPDVGDCRIRNFSSMYEQLTHMNSQAVYAYQGWVKSESKVNEILSKYLEVPLSEEQRSAYVRQLYKCRDEAVETSEKLLRKVVEEVGGKTAKWYDGSIGYVVKGDMNSYFVGKLDGKVYNNYTGEYICIVDHSRDMGAGFDALTTRLLVVKNDTTTSKMVTTLVGAAKSTAALLKDNPDCATRAELIEDPIPVVVKAEAQPVSAETIVTPTTEETTVGTLEVEPVSTPIEEAVAA